MHITAGDLDDPKVVDLLNIHMTTAHAETAPGSAHALDLSGLRAADVRLWTIWDGDRLAGVGALRLFDARHGEVKSMHTVAAMRGRGVGRAMLAHIIGAAREAGLERLSLETGSWPYFAPARAMYAAHGFVECAPFGDYRADPNSVFMTLPLSES